MSIPSYPLGHESLRVYDLAGYLKRAGKAARTSHRHEFWQLIAFDGRGRHHVDLRQYNHARRSILLLPDGAVHRFAGADTPGLLLHFPTSFFSRSPQDAKRLLRLLAVALDAPIFKPAAIDRDQTAALLDWIRAEAQRDTVDMEVQHGWLHALTLLLLRGADGNRPQRRDYLRFLEVVEQRYAERPTIASLVRELDMSTKHLYAVTAAAAGQPPGRIVEGRLVLEAKRWLVHSDEPVSAVGFELGFSDPAYFSRFFKKHVGVTPRDFRRRRGTPSG